MALFKSEVIAMKLLSRDSLAGMMFVSLAIWGFVSSWSLDPGTSVEMGPRYFPWLVSGILLLLGCAIMMSALLSTNPGAIEGWSLRPILAVSIAGVAFALLLQKGGIVLSVAVTICIGIFAGDRPRLIPLLMLIVVLVSATIGIFVFGIGIPLPIWPSI